MFSFPLGKLWSHWGKSDECPLNRSGFQSWAEEAQSNRGGSESHWEVRALPLVWQLKEVSLKTPTTLRPRTWKRSERAVFAVHCEETQFARGHGEKTLSLRSISNERGTEEEKHSSMAEAISFLGLLRVQPFYISSSPRQWMKNTITPSQIKFTPLRHWQS